MIELALNNVKKYYGANLVLSDISFTIQTGERVGVVGDNGCGKTTIFKGIAGIEPFDEGEVTFRKGVGFGYLNQIPQYPVSFTSKDVLEEAFTETFQKQQAMIKLADRLGDLIGTELEWAIQRYGELQYEFEVSGGYEIEEKFGRVCTGLKISQAMLEQPFGTLSGGEKTTVVLGQILLRNPDILLLDEPTNHLDLESIEWLEGYLREYKGTVVIISHDRYFLDEVVTKIIEVEAGEATTYHCNYSAYVVEKERILLQEFEAYQDQQRKIKAMEETIKRLKEWGIRGDNPKFHKQAASIQKRLDKMNKLDRPILEKDTMGLKFCSGDRSGKEVVVGEALHKSYGSKSIFNGLDVMVRYKERVAIVGKNGSGKSTLLKVLLGLETLDSGELRLGSRARTGYLSQEVSFSTPELTVLQSFRELFRISEQEARRRLARFMFYPQDVGKIINNLSGGEKSRLRLCELMQAELNFLILDEPTNHLDISSIEVLEDALLDFPGTIIFVSHDRYFINKLAQRILELEAGIFNEYLGNYDYYREKKDIFKAVKPTGVAKKQSRVQKVTSEGEHINPKINQEQLEQRVSALEMEISELDAKMIAAADDFEQLQDLGKQREGLSKELDGLINQWVELFSELG